MRTRNFCLLMGSLVAAAVGVTQLKAHLSGKGRPVASQSSVAADRAVTPRAQARAAAVATSASALAPIVVEPTPASQPDTAREPSPEPDDAELEATDKLRTQVALVSLSNDFDAEALDRGWAREAAQSISSSVKEKLGERSQVESVECRSSLCRMDVVHQDDEARQSFLTRTFGQPPIWSGEMVALQNSDERAGNKTVVFFGRQGRSLNTTGG